MIHPRFGFFRRALGATCVAALLICGWAHAEPEALPDSAITTDTMVLLRFNLATLTPSAVRQGAQKLKIKNDPLLIDWLGKYESGFNGLKGTGVDRAYLVVTLDESSGVWQTTFIVHLKAESDIPAAEKALARVTGQDAAATKFDSAGGFLSIHPAHPLAADRAPGAASIFQQALAQSPDASIEMAIVPNAMMRMMAQLALPELAPEDLAPQMLRLFDCRWVLVAARAGAEAGLQVVGQADSEAQAKLFTDTANASVDRLRKRNAALIHPDESFEGVDLAIALLHFEQNKTQVTASLKSDATAAAANLIIGGAIAHARELARQQTAIDMRQLALGIRAYAEGHNQLPDTLDDIADEVGGKEMLQRLLVHPVSGAKPGFIYVKPSIPLTSLGDRSKVPVLFESDDGKPNRKGDIAYLDGHVESAEDRTTTRP